ncbi:hypothetical protein TWF718_000301 [Orbilia javanica]|uniref:Uncharacterized protein n=1 Tax=Orbilia javanica TaxID=47235 RepID=A0AAN8MZG8_9PEZI
MAGAVEWSRNAADADSEQFAVEAQLRFSQQSDPDGLLKVPRHYIPVFVLHMFCKSERSRPFVLPDSERVAKIKAQLAAQRKLTSTCPSWQLVSQGGELLDNETFIIFDTRSKRFDKRHWTECFKYDEPYQKFFEKFTMKEFTREGWKFQKFEKLQRIDQGIMDGMWKNAYKVYDAMDVRRQESSDVIRLRRSDVWDFRKYLFLMTFLRNRDRNTHLLQTSDAMAEAKEKRTAFMAIHSLNHPRDLWLHNATIILDTPHHQISYHKLLFDLDQEDYRTNARERFMVFWEAGPNDEFILTDNSFGGMEIGRLEAKHTMPKRLKPSDLQKRLYSRDYMWHQIFVLSPKLAVALCHGTMINQSLAHQHRDRYGLRPSLLDRLPHPLPQGYYKDMHLKECKFLKPEWKIPDEVEDLFGRQADKGKYVANLDAKANSDLEFMVSTLSSAQVGLVNMILLQNQSISTAVDKVVYRNPAALYRAIEEYGKNDWPIFMDEKQHSYKSLKKKIYNQFNKPANGHESSRSSSGSSDQGTRSSGSSSTRRSEKKVVFEDRRKPTPEPPRPAKKPESANPFMSDSESSDDDDDDLAFPSSTHEPVLRSRSPSPVRRMDSPVKKEPVAPRSAEVKIEIEPAKPVIAPVPQPVVSGAPSQRATPSPRPTPSPEPPKSVTPPLAAAEAEKAIIEKLEKAKAEEIKRFEKEMAEKEKARKEQMAEKERALREEMAEKEKALKEEMAEKERIIQKEKEAIDKLRRERLQLEAEIEKKRRDELEATRMQRQKSERSGRPDERGDDRIRAASTKSAETRRRPRSKDRAEAELVDVGKQLALLEVEREKMRKEKQELEEMQHRKRKEEEKENQKKIDRMAKEMAMLREQVEVYETRLEEERQEKEMVRRMAVQQREKVDLLTRQTRELLEAQERDQTRADVERAARAEKDRLEKLEKLEKEKREHEKAKEREHKKRQERERMMNEKAEQERMQREMDIQMEKEREAERAKRHREREQDRVARAKNRQSRYDLHERTSDLSDEVDPQALFRKNRMILGALSPTSDPGMHLPYNEMTPPSSSHSHPDQFDDRRFEREMRSQSPPSPRLGYQYPSSPSPRRGETSPVPLGPNHRRGTQPKLLALEYESPPSSGFQTSPDSPNPPLDLALYAPPKEKTSRRKADPRDRDAARDMHPHAHGRAPQPQVRRFETPAPLPHFNDLNRRMSKIPTHIPDYATIHNGDRYQEDEYDDDDYGNGYNDAMARLNRAPKNRLQIEPPPTIKPQYQTRQKPPPRALPPADYRNGR